MTRTAAAPTDAELVAAIESTLFLYPPVPGLSQDLGIPGLRGRITKLSSPLTNLVGDARLSELEADGVIARVRDRYAPLAFGWVTGPSTRPTDLPRRLEAAGLEHDDSIAGMALTDLTTRIEVNPKVRVEESPLERAQDHAAMMGRAYDLTVEVVRFFNDVMIKSAAKIKARGYFAYLDGDAPVAWGVLIYLPDSPLVLLGGAATLLEHRGQGLYTALVARRLADARADGRTAAVIQAVRNTSAPICAGLGFRELCGLELYARKGA